MTLLQETVNLEKEFINKYLGEMDDIQEEVIIEILKLCKNINFEEGVLRQFLMKQVLKRYSNVIAIFFEFFGSEARRDMIRFGMEGPILDAVLLNKDYEIYDDISTHLFNELTLEIPTKNS